MVKLIKEIKENKKGNKSISIYTHEAKKINVVKGDYVEIKKIEDDDIERWVKILRFIVNERYIKMINFINNKKPSLMQISKYTKFHYPHVLTVIKQFESENIIKPVFNGFGKVKAKSKGGAYIIELTEKGQVYNSLLQMIYMNYMNIKINNKEVLKWKQSQN